MPLYEYQCKKCQHRFEKIQKFSDPLVKKCPKCGGPVQQLLSAPAVQFKGSGWYVTDYARKSAGHSESGGATDGAKEGASAKAADKVEKSDSKKTEKKPEKAAKK